MAGPGEYVPDATEGITRVEDLPKPRIKRRSRNYPARRCRFCGRRAGRYAVASRTLHDLRDPDSGRPVDLVITYSKHCCPHCGRWFSVELSDLALPKCLYSRRVQRMAVRIVLSRRGSTPVVGREPAAASRPRIHAVPAAQTTVPSAPVASSVHRTVRVHAVRFCHSSAATKRAR